jgi:hypothetical protein
MSCALQNIEPANAVQQIDEAEQWQKQLKAAGIIVGLF